MPRIRTIPRLAPCVSGDDRKAFPPGQELLPPPAAAHAPEKPGTHDRAPVPPRTRSCSDHAHTAGLAGLTCSTWQTKLSRLLSGATDHILGKGTIRFWRGTGKKAQEIQMKLGSTWCLHTGAQAVTWAGRLLNVSIKDKPGNHFPSPLQGPHISDM